MPALKETIQIQTRLLAIESVLARTIATLLVTSGKTTADVETFVESSEPNFEAMTFPGYDPAMSDLIADEFREHIKSIYGLVKDQVVALSKR